MTLGLHKNFQKHKTKHNSWQKWVDGLAYIGGIMIPVMTIPQLVKIIQIKSSASLSLLSWISYLIGVLFWVVYGISRKEKVIIITYSLSAIIYGLVVIAIIVYR